MEKNVLKDFETFEEFPDKYLLIDNKSNTFYIKINDKSFIVRRNIDCISIFSEKEKVKYEIAYYSVVDNKLVSKLTILKSINDLNEDLETEYKIVHLSKLLNIKGSSKYYLTLDDIKILTNYDKSKKVYKKILIEYFKRSANWSFLLII